MIKIEELIIKITPFLIMPLVFATIRIILEITLNVMRGNTKSGNAEIKVAEEKRPELNIDKDLKKYFNYKE